MAKTVEGKWTTCYNVSYWCWNNVFSCSGAGISAHRLGTGL
jgi:hypothetical protein